jgi:hypothetical protein
MRTITYLSRGPASLTILLLLTVVWQTQQVKSCYAVSLKPVYTIMLTLCLETYWYKLSRFTRDLQILQEKCFKKRHWKTRETRLRWSSGDMWIPGCGLQPWQGNNLLLCVCVCVCVCVYVCVCVSLCSVGVHSDQYTWIFHFCDRARLILSNNVGFLPIILFLLVATYINIVIM